MALILALICWASVPLFLKYFTTHLDAWTANGFRYGLSALFWSIPLGMQLIHHQVPLSAFRRAVIPALVNIPAQTMFAWAPYFLPPAFFVFLTRSSVVFSIALAFMIFPDERRAMRQKMFWAGCLLCLTGVLGLILAGKGLPAEAKVFGVGLALAYSVVLSFYGVSVRYYTRGVAPWVSFPIISIYTTWGLLIIMFLFGRPMDLAKLSGGDLTILVISAIVGIALGHTFYYHAIAHFGVSVCSGVMQLQPFFTALGSFFLFGEKLNGWQWIFGLLILGGAMNVLGAQARAAREIPPA